MIVLSSTRPLSVNADVQQYLRDPKNAPFVEEYEAAEEMLQRQGIDLAGYIQTRRIDEGLDASDVLFAAPAKSEAPPEPAGLDLSAGENAPFVLEYQQSEKHLEALGIDLPGYVQSRRIDEGLDALAVLTRATR